LTVTKRVGEAKAAALGLSLYDALLDEYEPGGRCHRIDALFAELAAFLPAMLQQVMDRQRASGEPLPLDGPFPVEAQRQLGVEMACTLASTSSHGRIDVSAHPFTGGTADDVRITTRYDERDFARALMGVLHETGHALYEAGLPRDWRRQPVGNARGMVLHESQSLLMEMQACRCRCLHRFRRPAHARGLRQVGPGLDGGQHPSIYTRVAPGFIRVDADEVTYPCTSCCAIAWSGDAGRRSRARRPAGGLERGHARLLGIVPPNDALGCLQDIHWPDGGWGYFPTYYLGRAGGGPALRRGAQGHARPDAVDRQGRLRAVAGLVAHQCARQGSIADTDTILSQATGAPLGTTAFKAHLESRYPSA
jgi:carboxypeptidase Taq